MKIVVFDFDGVIADSKDEVAVISSKAYEKMTGKAPPKMNDEHRGLMKTAEDIYAVFRLLSEGRELDFESVKEARKNWPDECRKFMEEFYAYRYFLMENEPESWLGRVKIYKGMDAIIHNVGKKYEIFISTGRDARSVKFVLSRNGIKMKEGNVIDRNFSTDKKDHMRYIAQKSGACMEEIVFIDDILEQVSRVGELGCKVILSSWGFSSKAQLREAEQNGITIAEISSLEEIINSA